MTFRGIDPDRLQWLLRHGLENGELLRFFREQRNPLLMKGEKVQNPPPDVNDAIARFARFSDSAHGLFGVWLRQQEPPDLQGIDGQLVQYFRAIELCNLRLTEGDLHRLARYGLHEIYADSPSSDWIAFLRSGIDPGTIEVPEEPIDEPAATAQSIDRESQPSPRGLVAVAPLRLARSDEFEYLQLGNI